MTVFAAAPSYAAWPAVAALIHQSFAYMEPLLGHPARAASVTAAHLAEAAGHGTAYLIEGGGTPVASLFTRPSRDFPDALYLGWLAVAETHRGQGLSQTVMAAAEAEARDQQYAAMTLDTGRVLTGLHAYFQRAGFQMLPGEGDIVSFRKPLA